MSKELKNSVLKNASKEWWTQNPQDYVDPGSIDHEKKVLTTDEEFKYFFDIIDKNFCLDAYFAQDRGSKPFERLMPADLQGKKVLEVGSGMGFHTELLVKRGAIVTSVDISQYSVQMTQKRLQMKGLSAHVIEADAEHLPFDNDAFDLVWSWGVIHHTPDTKAAASEIYRVMKPNAQLRIMLYNRHSLYNWVNVIFRYGVLKGKLLSMSLQDLKNRYTDGKKKDGAPLSKYYSIGEIKRDLFPQLSLKSFQAFEQKNVISTFCPARYRRKLENIIPDKIYGFFWRRLGFLLFVVFEK